MRAIGIIWYTWKDAPMVSIRIRRRRVRNTLLWFIIFDRFRSAITAKLKCLLQKNDKNCISTGLRYSEDVVSLYFMTSNKIPFDVGRRATSVLQSLDFDSLFCGLMFSRNEIHFTDKISHRRTGRACVCVCMCVSIEKSIAGHR